MQRIFQSVRLFPSSYFVRLNSTNKIPVQNQLNIDKDDEDDDRVDGVKKNMSSQDYIFADSKSARFKEKNKHKQKKWNKELEQRQIVPKKTFSPLLQKNETESKPIKKDEPSNKIIRDTYVTPDGIVREEKFAMNFDTELDENEQEEEPDEPVPLAVGGRRYPVWYYAGKLKQLASQNKVQETLHYFYNEMMDKERVAPNLFCYQIVIGICARNGYLTQAFNLYREMKDRGFSTVESRKMTKIFTLLATACYRSSDSTMAIDRAIHFLNEMKEKGFRIEYRTYNALIAAFGKHQQLKMAFQLADEMVEVGFIPNEDTYASLLIACNAEKNAGFRYAIEVWRRMLAFDVKPTPFHFGLLLNITSQCGLGSTESMHKLLLPPHTTHLLSHDESSHEHEEKHDHREPSFLSAVIDDIDHSLFDFGKKNEEEQSVSVFPEISEYEDPVQSTEISSEWWQDPNDIRQGQLLGTHLVPFSNASILKPNISYQHENLVSLRMPRNSAERLTLLGGIPGILKHMQECNVSPNNIMFNTLLNLIPPVTEHEQALLHVSNMCQVKPDIQFYNILILRRLRRRAKQEALQVLDMMRDQCLSPDHFTFSALARSCENRQSAEQLLQEMKELNLKPNQKVLDAMLNTAFHTKNFPLLAFICESYRTYNLPVNESSLRRIEQFLQDIRTKILAMEKANISTEQYQLLSSTYDRFKKFYDKWIRTVSYSKRFDQKVSFVFDKPDLKK